MSTLVYNASGVPNFESSGSRVSAQFCFVPGLAAGWGSESEMGGERRFVLGRRLGLAIGADL
jgi:hypothetical protein